MSPSSSHRAGPRADRVERILRRARRSAWLRDVLILTTVRVWTVLAALAGILFARWYRPTRGRAYAGRHEGELS
jgi:hypothetical protein